MSVSVEKQRAIRVHGEMFTEHVIIPAPSTVYFAYDDAVTAVTTIFERIEEKYKTHISTPKNNGIETIAFKNTLRNTVTAVLTTYSHNKHDSDTEASSTELTNDIRDVINTVFPTASELRELPDTIYSLDIAIHITRITIQSIFDALNEEQSQMSKEHPFNIQKHS